MTRILYRVVEHVDVDGQETDIILRVNRTIRLLLQITPPMLACNVCNKTYMLNTKYTCKYKLCTSH
jgi:hypothetical protein